MSHPLLASLGFSGSPQAISIGQTWLDGNGETLNVNSPIDHSALASFQMASAEQVNETVTASTEAFKHLSVIPAPRRGEFVRRFAESLREHQDILSELIVNEVGKISAEAHGEVQEMIDVCDFAGRAGCKMRP